MMSMSKVHSKYLKCPICSKTPDYQRIENFLTDAMTYRDNRPFDPEDPIIVSEIYCTAECYAVAVIREEEHNV